MTDTNPAKDVDQDQNDNLNQKNPTNKTLSETDSNLEQIFQTDNSGNSETDQNLTKKFKFWPQKKWQQAVVIMCAVLLILLSAGAVMGFYTYRVGRQLQQQGVELKQQAQSAYDQFKQQNLPATKQELLNAQAKLNEIEVTYQKLGFMGSMPIIKKYFEDGQAGLNAADHALEATLIAVKAFTPYADVLGFEGEGSFSQGTAEDRIAVMVQTLDKVTPELDAVESHLTAVQEELQIIDPNDYPEEIRDMALRSQIVQGKELVDQGILMLTEFRPVIEQLPDIAGARGEVKKYIILFQNDNELRPTGGFLTAYAVIKMENGKIIPEKSDDIYALDQRFSQRIPIPEELGRYLTTERYWNLRDMNISPDFKVSMDTFFKYYQTIPGEPENIDGIIAVDTNVLTALLEILGPTEVPGYGTFTAENDPRCDCPQVVYALSEIITRPTPYIRENRKGILGPMMQAILLKTYAAPKQKWPELFNFAWSAMQAKHLQAYFIDEQNQLAMENLGAAGRLELEENVDFIAIVDANLGGAKSNLFTNYEVEQYIKSPQNGKIIKTVEITYRNTRKADNCNLEAGELCLNSTLDDWHRLYLPAGTELIEAQGFSEEPKQYEELGFHVIDGFFKLEPKAVAKIKLKYSVPYQENEYRLKIWKQGGIDPFETLIDVNGNQAELTINQDTIYTDIF
jgi:hypothetical protein